ncbi:tyrosinase-like protein 2 [Mizuhopecten yessoensis]|uniref:tyrosinase-like protein 2 n=1 Tax=Mizuhopecten yessoensis TaxID=6573 RepID=UPI000B45DD54|nr:tyrosinase-like protein 2 [Mizuhopecten yessoensis]
MQAVAGLFFAGIVSRLFSLPTGQEQHLHGPSRNRTCQQYRGHHGHFEIFEQDDSVYCLHQHLYQSALDTSPANVLLVYAQELLIIALSRCGSRDWPHWLTERQQCNNGSTSDRCRTKTREIKACEKQQARITETSSNRKRKSKGRKITKCRRKCCRSEKGSKQRKKKCERRQKGSTDNGKKRLSKIQSCSWGRKEVRMMTRSEWKRFVDRLNILKESIPVRGGQESFVPYDVISDLHRNNVTINTAHGGPNFLGWHRVYLLLLEAALGVSIPYWDSRLDHDMSDPTDSVVWTNDFFGPGFGVEDTGPFANWITPDNESLVRNIGNNGSLMSADMVDTLLRYTRHDQAVEPTINSIEDIHEGPHRWVDGQLSSLETAPQDPVFFLHHSFVDYIWYLLRENMRKGGDIDPAFDYPCKGPRAHERYATMFPFGSLPNLYGYSDHLESLTHYIPSPACPDCGQSPYLYCDEGIRRCKSKAARPPAHSLGSDKKVKTRYRIRAIGILHLGRKFGHHKADVRTRGDTLTFLPLTNRGLFL